MKGSFALGIIFKNYKNIIIGARRGSPLAVGYSNSENYLGSDSYALKSMTNKISYLNDGEFCIVKRNNVDFFDEKGMKINGKRRKGVLFLSPVNLYCCAAMLQRNSKRRKGRQLLPIRMRKCTIAVCGLL